MEKEIEALFTEKIITLGAQLFDVEYNSLIKLGSFENYVFSGIRDGEETILRFTHSSHRSKEQVEAELAWLQFLQTNLAPVCGPFLSIHQKLVEVVEAEETFFFVSLFEKAKGNEVKVTDTAFNEELFFRWGAATGILHRLSEQYIEPENVLKRPDLVEEFQVQFAPFIPNDSLVQEKVTEVLQQLQRLPKTKERYRLIHSDIHSGNFFYDGTKVTIFDFDDASYHQIIGDIAIPIYYSVWFNRTISDKDSFINETFLPAFIKGYLSEHFIQLELLNDIPLLLRLRDCELYGVLHKKWDLSSLNEKQQQVLTEIKERIVSRTPIVNCDFSKLA